MKFDDLLKWSIIIITLVYVSACSLIKNKTEHRDFYHLQALPNSLQNKTFLEILTFEQEQKQTLVTQIETTQQTLILGAMTLSGLPIVQAKWHNNQGLIDFESTTFDEDMVIRIIRDIQLIKWPEQIITLGLIPGYEVLTTTKSLTSSVRTIVNDDKEIIKITYSGDKIKLINTEDHYQLIIEQINE